MKVSDQIIQVLNALCEKFGMAIDWTSDNVIPYATTLFEKLIAWEIWSSVAWMAIVAVLSIISIIIAVRCKTFSEDFFDDFDILGFILDTVFICLWIGTAICIIVQIFDIIKCCTFPELFVFEYIQAMINSAG